MGEFDYGAADMLNMSISLRYDWATIERLNGRAEFRVDLETPPIPDSIVGP